MIWPAAAKAESMKRGLVARLKVGPFPFVHKSTSRSLGKNDQERDFTSGCRR